MVLVPIESGILEKVDVAMVLVPNKPGILENVDVAMLPDVTSV